MHEYKPSIWVLIKWKLSGGKLFTVPEFHCALCGVVVSKEYVAPSYLHGHLFHRYLCDKCEKIVKDL